MTSSPDSVGVFLHFLGMYFLLLLDLKYISASKNTETNYELGTDIMKGNCPLEPNFKNFLEAKYTTFIFFFYEPIGHVCAHKKII